MDNHALRVFSKTDISVVVFLYIYFVGLDAANKLLLYSVGFKTLQIQTPNST